MHIHDPVGSVKPLAAALAISVAAPLVNRPLNRPLFAGDPEVRILGHGKDEERNTLSRGTAR
ncbi:hypothetical protein J1C52_14925, partial [Roseibaca sp. Y0-43]|nr:hypothetical protein [Roseibaca sp. Y0-43]